MPYSRDYKRKYEFFRRKMKKQVSDIVSASQPLGAGMTGDWGAGQMHPTVQTEWLLFLIGKGCVCVFKEVFKE